QTLKEVLGRIDAIKDTKDGKELGREVARLHRRHVGVLFDFDSQQDFKDATQIIGVADQGGMALPDRDYYLKDDDKSKQIRALYEEHVGKLLELLGVPQKAAAAQARTVMQLETAL